MYCPQCQYDLRGLTRPRFPECGREFDPGDPNSYDERPVRLPRWPYWIAAAGAAYPWTLIGGFVATWLTAKAVLGRAPQASLDDPKQLGPLVDVVYGITAFACYGLPLGAVLILSGVLSVAGATRAPRRSGAAVEVATLILASWGLAYFVYIGYPKGIAQWFFD